jgi:hypothetical protein
MGKENELDQQAEAEATERDGFVPDLSDELIGPLLPEVGAEFACLGCGNYECSGCGRDWEDYE